MIQQVLKARRAFIGYPPHRPNQDVGQTNLHAGLYDITNIEDWPTTRQNIIKTHGIDNLKRGKSYANQVAGNINLVRDAVPGSIILVPRPDQGLVYAGTVEKFELLNNPLSEEWGEDYKRNRIENGLNKPEEDMATHVQDISQSFKIMENDWIKIPFVSFPTWMQRTFFGRRTTSRLRGIKQGITNTESLTMAYEEACRLMKTASQHIPLNLIPEWTNEPHEVKQRLYDRVNAQSFEHLVVSLVQLENEHDEQWIQCGGSGDGGIDGIGTKVCGQISLLQCKWEFWGKSFSFRKTVHGENVKRRYFAYLNGPDKNAIEFSKDIYIWDADEITKLVLKHSSRLPMAVSLRVRTNNAS